MKELIKIQDELKAPKGQRNSFGNYNYRSCEDILEAVKPLCVKNGCLLTISDEMIILGDRFYIKATVKISKIDLEKQSGDQETSVSVSAYAREPESKKGMDASQITGAASSYARKYALNGLFCIDDTKDADTMNNSSQGHSEPQKQINKATTLQRSTLKDYLSKFKSNNDTKAIDYINESLVNPNFTEIEASTIIKHCKTKLGE